MRLVHHKGVLLSQPRQQLLTPRCVTPGLLFLPSREKKKKTDELDARACDLRAEVARATQDGAALREDASAAAARASEARRSLASAEHETASLASQAETLRATKRALDSELAGLRHELDTLRRRRDGDGGGTMATGGGGGGKGAGWKEDKRGEGDHLLLRAEKSSTRGAAAVLSREGCVRGVGGSHGARETLPPPSTTGRPERSMAMCASEDGVGGGGRHSDGGNLVEIVAEFQSRLRRQVQAALADGGVGTSSTDGGDDGDGRIGRGSTSAALARSSSFSQVTTVGLVDGDAPPRVRLRRQTPADSRGASLITHRRPKDGAFSGRAAGGMGGGDVLGELEKRIGSV